MEDIKDAAYQARRDYQDEVGKNGMNECIMFDAMKIQKGFELGAVWERERSQKILPFYATDVEVFAIKPDENGKMFAYIGYKIANGNFHFTTVPFTEPK